MPVEFNPTTDLPYKSAIAVGEKLGKSQNTLMAAYNIDEGNVADVKKLAKDLNMPVPKTEWVENPATGKKDLEKLLNNPLRGLQLVAEQRYQHGSQVLNMFSGLLDKIDQLKQRLISKFSN